MTGNTAEFSRNPISIEDVGFVCVCNDQGVLEGNLKRSKVFRESQLPLLELWHRSSACTAYDEATRLLAGKKYLVFLHQDVYLPRNWLEQIFDEIHRLESHDPNWAVVGLAGMDASGKLIGNVWCSSKMKILGDEFGEAQPVKSLDELLLIVNTESGVAFDTELPSFHLYGTDLVLQGLVNGRKSYVINAPVVHNTRQVTSLAGGYAKAYWYMRKKWWNILPVRTPCSWISKTPVRYFRTRFGLWRRTKLKQMFGPGIPQNLPLDEILKRSGIEECPTATVENVQ